MNGDPAVAATIDPDGEHGVRRSVLEALRGRRSVRAFLPDAVDRQTVESILEAAAWSPSGSNIQPWRVQVLHGTRRHALARALMAAHDAGQEAPDYDYYPKVWR